MTNWFQRERHHTGGTTGIAVGPAKKRRPLYTTGRQKVRTLGDDCRRHDHRCADCGARLAIRERIPADPAIRDLELFVQCDDHRDGEGLCWSRSLGYALHYVKQVAAGRGQPDWGDGDVAVCRFVDEFDANYWPGVSQAEIVLAAELWKSWPEEPQPVSTGPRPRLF